MQPTKSTAQMRFTFFYLVLVSAFSPSNHHARCSIFLFTLLPLAAVVNYLAAQGGIHTPFLFDMLFPCLAILSESIIWFLLLMVIVPLERLKPRQLVCCLGRLFFSLPAASNPTQHKSELLSLETTLQIKRSGIFAFDGQDDQ